MSICLYSLRYQDQTIPFVVLPSRGRSLTLRVGFDQKVMVRAPKYVRFEQIANFVKTRADWVLAKRAEVALLNRPSDESYENGSRVSFLGKEYQIEVRAADSRLVKAYGKRLIVKVPAEATEKRVAKLIADWYREQALAVFTERMQICYQKAKRIGIRPVKALQIRKMKSRWGSCRKNGNITLNLMLIKLPLPVIDYVIMHELCHLKEFNHSSAFYALLDRLMPGWQEQRDRLSTYVL